MKMASHRSALAQLRAALEPVLAPHGFVYDEANNGGADPDRPWVLFHADPPTVLDREALVDWFATVDVRYPLPA
jgi:hypothetical protein